MWAIQDSDSLYGMKCDEEIIVESFSSGPARLRIALVTETFPPEVNGVAMTLEKLVSGLLAKGHEIQVVRPRQGNGDVGHPRDGLQEVLARGVPVPNYGGLKFGLPSGRKLNALWKMRRPDIVHVATEGPLGWSAVTAARKLNLPVTSSFHTNFDNYTEHYGIGLLKSPVEAYLKKMHNRTQATLVPTRQLLKSLEARGFRNLSLMSRGVSAELFNPSRRSQALRQAWGLSDADLAVIHVGRLAKEKNISAVVATFALIKARNPGAKLVFVGAGPMLESLQQTCGDAVFAGQRSGEDLAAHYASGDLFLFPSQSETYGNVVPEALASGLAVVSFNQAAASELIRDGINGRIVAPGDELAFMRAALDLACDRTMRDGIRAGARRSVAHLDWAAVQEQFLRTAREVIARHAGRSPGLKHALVTTGL